MTSQKQLKKRLDSLLVERGFFPTRTKAQAAIMAGAVRIKGCPAPKPGQAVRDDLSFEIIQDANPFVSRGGLKLAAALDAFLIKTKGRIALDLGASTGGFTDCLLQRGAAKVYAVDVGRGQLDQKLRNDPRVVSLEKTHARDLTANYFKDGLPNLLTADVSFISLTKVLSAALSVLARPCELILLVKPQFELEPKLVPKGIVRTEENRLLALERVRGAAAELGLLEKGMIPSPLKGSKGNVEFLLYLT